MSKIELVDKTDPLFVRQERFIQKVLEVANRHAFREHEIELIQSFHDPFKVLGTGEYKYIFQCSMEKKVVDSITLYIDFSMMSESYAVTCGVYVAEEFKRLNKV
jgi:hypothetical protein